jgi:hypothetical protein
MEASNMSALESTDIGKCLNDYPSPMRGLNGITCRDGNI